MEPFGQVRQDELAGEAMAIQYNMHRSPGQEVVKWHDLVFNAESPKFEEAARKANEAVHGPSLDSLKDAAADEAKQSERFLALAKAWNARWDAAVKAGAKVPSRKKRKKG
jgi:hypothetical protein